MEKTQVLLLLEKLLQIEDTNWLFIKIFSNNHDPDSKAQSCQSTKSFYIGKNVKLSFLTSPRTCILASYDQILHHLPKHSTNIMPLVHVLPCCSRQNINPFIGKQKELDNFEVRKILYGRTWSKLHMKIKLKCTYLLPYVHFDFYLHKCSILFLDFSLSISYFPL